MGTPNQLSITNTLLALGRDVNQAAIDEALQARSLNAWARNLTVEEAGSTFVSQAAFVESLYINLLGPDREVSENDISYWVGEMNKGVTSLTPGQVAASFAFEATKEGTLEADLSFYEEQLAALDLDYREDDRFQGEIPVEDDENGDDQVSELNFEREFTTLARDDSNTTSRDDVVNDIWNIGREAIDAGEDARSDQYTIKMENVLGQAGNTANAYFISPLLNAEGRTIAQGNRLQIEMLDQLAENDDLAIDQLIVRDFSFALDGTTYTMVEEGTAVADNPFAQARTYDDLVEAIEARLEALGLADLVAVSTQEITRSKYNPESTDEVIGQLTGQRIILESTTGAEIQRGGFDVGARPGATNNVKIVANAQTTDTSSVTEDGVIATDLELQNVGYGSQGVGINVAGQSNSFKGVEHFNVEAKGHAVPGMGVWLTELASRDLNDGLHLESIKLTGDADYFKVGTQNGETVQAVTEANSEVGLENVATLDATDFAGDVHVAAYAGEAKAYNYTLSNGDNVVFFNTTANTVAHKDFSLDITTGNGDDVINVDLGLGTANTTTVGNNGIQLVNQQLLSNVSIDAGHGDNRVMTEGAGSVSITTGRGEDNIFTDNSGDKAQFIFNSVQGYRGNTELSNSDAEFTARANGQDQTFDLFNANVQVTFKGFESDFIAIESTNGQTSTAQINQAIIKAISEDRVLSELLSAEVGMGETLLVEALIDGRLNLNDLNVNIIAPQLVEGNETNDERAAREAAGRQAVTEAQLEQADVTINDLQGTVNGLNNGFYNTAFRTEGNDTNLNYADQVINFAGYRAAIDNEFFDGGAANIITVGGVEVTLTAGMSSEDIATAVANTINNGGVGTELDLRDGHSVLFTATAAGSQVTLEAQSDVVYPFGDNMSLVRVSTSVSGGNEDGYLSSTRVSDIVTTGGLDTSDYTAGNDGSGTAQQTRLDFTGRKIDPENTSTISFSNEGDDALDLTIPNLTIPAGAGPLQIANLVAQHLENQLSIATATVENARVTVTFEQTPSATPGEEGEGNYGTIKLEMTNVVGQDDDLELTGNNIRSFAGQEFVESEGEVKQTLDFINSEVTEGGVLQLGTGINLTVQPGWNDLKLAFEAAAVLNNLAGVEAEVDENNPTRVNVTVEHDSVNFGNLIQQDADGNLTGISVNNTPQTAAAAEQTLDLADAFADPLVGNAVADTEEFTLTIGGETYTFTATANLATVADVAAQLAAANFGSLNVVDSDGNAPADPGFNDAIDDYTIDNPGAGTVLTFTAGTAEAKPAIVFDVPAQAVGERQRIDFNDAEIAAGANDIIASGETITLEIDGDTVTITADDDFALAADLVAAIVDHAGTGDVSVTGLPAGYTFVATSTPGVLAVQQDAGSAEDIDLIEVGGTFAFADEVVVTEQVKGLEGGEPADNIVDSVSSGIGGQDASNGVAVVSTLNTGIVSGGQHTNDNGDAIRGSDSLAESDNTINAGAGDDLIVLGTGQYSNEIVVLSGNFGHNTIVNFSDARPDRLSDGDWLDFTSYLNSNTADDDVNDVTLNTTTGTVQTNAVTVVNFNALQANASEALEDLSFADLSTGTTLSNAINEAYEAVEVASQNVFLIHNEDNAGEYLVARASSANNSDEFTVNIVGTLDFGEAQNNLSTANLVTFADLA